MSRGNKIILSGILFSIFWVLAYFQSLEDPHANNLVKALPSYFIILLGCYSVFEIGLSIFSIKDAPEEYQYLLEDIKRAKTKLPAKFFQ